MPERRSQKRIAAQLKVWCEGEDLTVLASTLNLSRDGVFLRTSRPFEASTRLRLTIDELGVVAEGEVRWGRPTRDPGSAGVGVRLVTFERGAAAWERYLEQNSSRSGEHRIVLPTDPPSD
jgi:hypothetical protein